MQAHHVKIVVGSLGNKFLTILLKTLQEASNEMM